MQRLIVAGTVFVFLVSSLLADHVTMTGGKVYEGEILQENPDNVTFRLDHGVITISRQNIVSVDHRPPAAIQPPISFQPQNAPAASRPRIPAWLTVTQLLAKQPWATNLKQIPSTVIDIGVMRAVPYSSYRCGEDYEVNVYGDPDAPAAVEIGIYRSLLASTAAQDNCVAFLCSLLGDPADASIARLMNRKKDLVTRGDVTIEITPATDPDAYGGWWISVYSSRLLDSSRASKSELDAITVPKSARSSQAGKSSGSVTDWSSSDMQSARPTSSDPSQASVSPLGSASSGPTSSGSGNYSSGPRVYVRGYTRKNGTYVAPYTRAAPGYGSHSQSGGHR